MNDASNGTTSDADKAARTWLNDFDAAMLAGDIDAATALFAGDGMWRDLLAFSWHIETMTGAAEIGESLRRA